MQGLWHKGILHEAYSKCAQGTAKIILYAQKVRNEAKALVREERL